MKLEKKLSQTTCFNLFLIFLSCFIFLLQGKEDSDPSILVTIAPYEFFVKKIAEDTVKVHIMVPAGASAHTYEPTPKQTIQATKANIWFRMGEPFEDRIIPVLKSYNSLFTVVDLRDGVPLIKTDPLHSCCHAHSSDPHFWLSARLAHIQADTIASTLITLRPEHASLYRENLKKFHQELDELDKRIQKILEPMINRNILVSHPAYAYFCRDYNIIQYSIEFEGKDPTPQQLTKILNLAKSLKFKTIFIQKQYSSKGARLIAENIGAQLITLDPYSERYIETMIEIAQAFAHG